MNLTETKRLSEDRLRDQIRDQIRAYEFALKRAKAAAKFWSEAEAKARNDVRNDHPNPYKLIRNFRQYRKAAEADVCFYESEIAKTQDNYQRLQNLR